MRAGDADGGMSGRWVLQVFSLQEADKYLRRIQMRITDAAHGKLQFEQTNFFRSVCPGNEPTSAKDLEALRRLTEHELA
jgi:hypothetical protein